MHVLLTIQETNLSKAWARAFLGAQRGGQEFCPFLLSLEGFNEQGPQEIDEIRDALDNCLELNDHDGVNTVANTIFPQSLWHQAKGDRTKLYAEYKEYLPDYVAMAPSKNRAGLYFARLIGYGICPKDGTQESHLPSDRLEQGGNQLEFIIQHCKQGARRAMLQAAIYDPMRDQSGAAQQGFPCLQHLTFVPDFTSETLALNAFYASQQLFVKAYGNWLGLIRLGMFVASQVNLRFSTMNCFAGIEKMDMRPKSGPELDRLRLAAKAAVEQENVEPVLQ